MEISETERFNIIFRYKQRLSLTIIDNKDVRLVIDATIVKTNENSTFTTKTTRR